MNDGQAKDYDELHIETATEPDVPRVDERDLLRRKYLKPGFGFWMALVWTLLYFVVTQVIAGIGLGFVVFGIALIPEIRENGVDWALNAENLTAWMKGPNGTIATLILVAGTQYTGLALTLLLLRLVSGRTWKRKIALTRLPSATQAALLLIGFPAMLALAACVEAPISKYVPSMQEVLNAIGLKIEFEGSEGLPEMIRNAPWGLAILVIGLTPGICEEFFCRGFIAQGLSGRYSSWAVVGITSLFFGCLHVDPRQGIGAMLLGLAIHGAYLATRSFIVPVLIHFGNNGVAVVHIHKKMYPVLETMENLVQSSPFLLFAAGALLFAAVTYALVQTRSRNVSTVPGLEPWRSEGVSGVELPPPGGHTIVASEPISALSIALVVTAAIAFGAALAFA